MLVFKLDELPELGAGQGVQLQRYRDGGSVRRDRLRWPTGSAGRWAARAGPRTETDLTPWRAIRGAAGGCRRMGFPRDNRFE